MSPTASVFLEQISACAKRLRIDGVEVLGGLFDLTGNRLVRYATSLTRNQHDAEDAVQAALTRVALRPDLLGQAANPWAYLLRSVRNEAFVIARRSRRNHGAPNLLDLRTRRRVDELEREESQRAIWLALRQIPVEQAEVVVLKLWELWTFEAIGDYLGISPHTAASRYQYALKKLAGLLGDFAREVAP